VRQPKRVRIPTLKNGRPSMNIAIIGSTGYQERMHIRLQRLMDDGHEVKTPAFDDEPHLNELGIMMHNRDLIEWADEVHVFWDSRSIGTLMDVAMCIALRKPIQIIYMNKKTLANVLLQYEAECKVKT
jgi:hypothetical protein